MGLISALLILLWQGEDPRVPPLPLAASAWCLPGGHHPAHGGRGEWGRGGCCRLIPSEGCSRSPPGPEVLLPGCHEAQPGRILELLLLPKPTEMLLLHFQKNIHFRVIKIYKYLNHNLPIVAAVSHVISDTSVIMNVSHLAEVPVSI